MELLIWFLLLPNDWIHIFSCSSQIGVHLINYRMIYDFTRAEIVRSAGERENERVGIS